MKESDAGDAVRVVLKSEDMVLVALTFLHLANTAQIFLSSTDLCVHMKDVPLPEGHCGPMGLLTTVNRKLYEAVHNLGLFERDSG